MYIADKSLSAEKLMLEASFTRLINLFEEYKRTTENEINSLSETIVEKDRQIETFHLDYQMLVESLKDITVLPEEHEWAQKVKSLRQNVSDLLDEAHAFSLYANERLNLYKDMHKSNY
ncbi:hypothetical protein [Thorsellia anophelis]|uniref:Uncharacterized protein n=1 Tax=Thorsellia anophelis DSM 18579 TaxID=1123402 RepID=A0A1I0BZS2_9GAMM|nr:hypothetical protein [Thorsellia anophelis]SET12357.1 hypothetical protein SAMN02583745_01421 [Thorsellia anophelis DSM 18579]